MEYRVLGKLEVLRDGHPVDLGAFADRALLALLLTAPNSVFSSDQILDELWGDAGGVDKHNALWVYVSGLRKALEPDREKRTEGSILLTRAPGYLIEAEADQIDSLRFEQMVIEGRALADVDPAAASLVLGESLALWRGRAFEEFTYESFAQAEIARLEELRLEAVELRIDADLRQGLSRELISELESLVRQHPFKERITGQLMLALYRSSRQADALRAFQVLKSRLGEELGIDPSASLRKLEEQIVTGDEALEVRSRGSRARRRDGARAGSAWVRVAGADRCSCRGECLPRLSARCRSRGRNQGHPSRPRQRSRRSSAVSRPKQRSSRRSSIRTSFRCTTIGVSPTRRIWSCVSCAAEVWPPSSNTARSRPPRP